MSYLPTNPVSETPTLRDAWSLLADGMQYHRFFLEVKPSLLAQASRDLIAVAPEMPEEEVHRAIRRFRPGVGRLVAGYPDEAERLLAGALPLRVQLGTSHVPVYRIKHGRLTGVEVADDAVLDAIKYVNSLLTAVLTVGFVECTAHALVVTDDALEASNDLPVAFVGESDAPLTVLTSLIDTAATVYTSSFWKVGWENDDITPSESLRTEVADYAKATLRFRTLWRLKQNASLWGQVVEKVGIDVLAALYRGCEMRFESITNETVEHLLSGLDDNLILADFVRTLHPWSGQFQQYETGVGTGQAVG